MVADHLDVPFENMDVICSPAEQKRGAAQITGGSHNTRVLWDPIRVICAQMRGQLMAAGSQKLGVPVTALRTEDGHVIATDGRKVTYGELTRAGRQPARRPRRPRRRRPRSSRSSASPRPGTTPRRSSRARASYAHGPLLVQGVPADRPGHGRHPRRVGGVDRRLRGQGDQGRHRRHPHPGHARLPDPRGRGRHGRDLRYRQEGQERAQDQVERRPDGPAVGRPDRRHCSTGSSTR